MIRFREKGQHSSCTICARFKQYRLQAVTIDDKCSIQKGYREHLEKMFADRKTYQRLGLLSEVACRPGQAGQVLDSEAVLCICLDGMDQSKFACPLNIKATKEFSALWRPRLKFTGAIAHGISEYYFISDGDCPKDASTTCE